MQYTKVALSIIIGIYTTLLTINVQAADNCNGNNDSRVGCGKYDLSICQGEFDLKGGWGIQEKDSKFWEGKLEVTKQTGDDVIVRLKFKGQHPQYVSGKCKVLDNGMLALITFDIKSQGGCWNSGKVTINFRGLFSRTWTVPHSLVQGTYYDPSCPNMYPWSAQTNY